MHYAAWLLERHAPGALNQQSGSVAEVDIQGDGILPRLAKPSPGSPVGAAATPALGGIRRIWLGL